MRKVKQEDQLRLDEAEFSSCRKDVSSHDDSIDAIVALIQNEEFSVSELVRLREAIGQGLASEFTAAKEAAGIVGCTIGHIRRLLKSGTLIGYQTEGGDWYVSRTDARRLRAELDSRGKHRGRPRLSERINKGVD